MIPPLQPLDIVVVDGLWYMPHHWLIRWRGLDPGVHCFTIVDPAGNGWSPEFTGIKRRHLDHYKGRHITIHRLKEGGQLYRALSSCFAIEKTATGYDFKQWFGFFTGLLRRCWIDDATAWTCAELPYWAIHNLQPITAQDELLPMPRLFRYNQQFETIFKGVW
jgi:hypothetical protein